MSGPLTRSEQPRLRAPTDDGAALIAPPPAELDCVLSENRATRSEWQYDFQGKPLTALVEEARSELFRSAVDYTQQYREVPSTFAANTAEFLLAGHQPELFHPGVWLKNFALGAMARRRGAVAVNLLIDNDTIKAARLKVPTGTPENPRVVSVPFDQSGAVIPYEERRIIDRALFDSFGCRAVEIMRSLVPHPMLQSFWPTACWRAGEVGNLGLSLAQARHIVEGRWGLETLEVPQSRVCVGESFRWFTAHLLAQLPRFHTEYNGAVAYYRRVHGVRSAAHPFPNLASKDGWLESPFWIWTVADSRRRPLFATCRRGRVVVSDGEAIEAELPLTPDGDGAAAVEWLGSLEAGGTRIRSRALTTTLWARLALSDLFIHGIGGAKYDEVTDRLFERFLGLRPPRLMVVSGTLLPPVPGPKGSATGQRELKQRLWQLRHHPECFLKDSRNAHPSNEENIGRLVDEKRRWVGTPQTRENARQRCHAIRQVNAALQPYVAGQRCRTAERLSELSRASEAARILQWREFSFCLHPEDSLRYFLDQALSKPSATCSNELTKIY